MSNKTVIHQRKANNTEACALKNVSTCICLVTTAIISECKKYEMLKKHTFLCFFFLMFY